MILHAVLNVISSAGIRRSHYDVSYFYTALFTAEYYPPGQSMLVNSFPVVDTVPPPPPPRKRAYSRVSL